MGNFLDSIVETTTKNIHYLETKEEIEYLKYYSKINKLIEEAANHGLYELTLTFKSINEIQKGYCHIEYGDDVIKYRNESLIETIENYYSTENFEVSRNENFKPTIKLTISWKEAILEQIL